MEKELPKEAGVNSILRLRNGKYVLDEKTTLEARDKITDMANDILNKQDEVLKDYRKEGHVYMVSEDVNDKIYLWDITDKPAYEIEEVDFPKELLNKAKEGALFQYVNGEYSFFSDEGFEAIYKNEV